MADQTQTQTVSTPVNFDDVSLSRLSFNETFRVTRGAASQIILGLQFMMTKLNSPSNEYQKSLYPQLLQLTQNIVDKYVKTFLQVSDPVTLQVFGANLNGHRNDGSLYRSVNSGVNRSLTYGYSQFGQLVKVLTSRLSFIENRDPLSVKRYAESTHEHAAYVLLQTKCAEFLKFLSSVNDEWAKVVETTRNQHNIQKKQRGTKTHDGQEWTQVKSKKTSSRVRHHRAGVKNTA